jgi:hypothetical protein
VSAGRVMSLHRTIVTPVDRTRFLERARQLRDHYATHRCRYWIFEETDLPGAFIEFTESADAALLSAALAGAPDPIVDQARIYKEVAL